MSPSLCPPPSPPPYRGVDLFITHTLIASLAITFNVFDHNSVPFPAPAPAPLSYPSLALCPFPAAAPRSRSHSSSIRSARSMARYVMRPSQSQIMPPTLSLDTEELVRVCCVCARDLLQARRCCLRCGSDSSRSSPGAARVQLKNLFRFVHIAGASQLRNCAPSHKQQQLFIVR